MAPPGSRGISLFLVPKFLPDADGAGRGSATRCAPLSLEHKLGIHASPTCVLAYEDAIGWRIGEENRGLEYMFTMMNNARLNVGVQGLAIAERAYQEARDFARTRVQGHPLGAAADAGPLPIIHHPDVRRMLLSMRAATEAMRALAYYAAASIDHARRDPDPAERGRAQRRADLLIPVVKAWCSDIGVAVASTGIQVHGGMGYIEETGAAQHLRDARIAPIYEGTNGIQANDLVGRKLARDQGEAARALFAEIAATPTALEQAHGADLAADRRSALRAGVAALETATAYLVDADPAAGGGRLGALSAAFGTVVGGWLMARQALAAFRRLAGGERTTSLFWRPRSRPRDFSPIIIWHWRRGIWPASAAAPRCSTSIPTASDRHAAGGDSGAARRRCAAWHSLHDRVGVSVLVSERDRQMAGAELSDPDAGVLPQCCCVVAVLSCW